MLTGGITQAGRGIYEQATAPPKPQTQIAIHANALHDMAARLTDLNVRLSNALDRAVGPIPEAAGIEKQPEPGPGVLVVAQFGAERIRLQLERMTELVNRLEQIS